MMTLDLRCRCGDVQRTAPFTREGLDDFFPHTFACLAGCGRSTTLTYLEYRRMANIGNPSPSDDMDLDSYVKSVSEMSDEELLSELANIRKDRRASVTSTRVARKVSKDKEVRNYKKRPPKLSETEVIKEGKKMSAEDLEALKKEFGL